MFKLGFLKIGGNPDVRRDRREQRAARLNQRTKLDVAPGNETVERRADIALGEIQFGGFQLCLRLTDLAFARFDVGLDLTHLQLHLGGHLDLRLGVGQFGTGLLCFGLGQLGGILHL